MQFPSLTKIIGGEKIVVDHSSNFKVMQLMVDPILMGCNTEKEVYGFPWKSPISEKGRGNYFWKLRYKESKKLNRFQRLLE